MLLAVLNSKGGVGKSTIAVHAAAWLHERGQRVAVVDADAQNSTSEWLAEAAPQIRIERCNTLAALSERMPRLTAAFPYVVADGPAALSSEIAALAAAADVVVMPIGPSLVDIRASYRTARLLYHVRLRLHGAQRPRVVVVLNRIQPRTRVAQLALASVQKYGFPVAVTCLHLRQAYAEACGRGTVVWHMGAAAQHAAEEMQQLLAEVLADAPAVPVPLGAAAMPATTPRTIPAGDVLPAGQTLAPVLPAAELTPSRSATATPSASAPA
jgi:chromosome partitioning protein